MSYYPPNPHYDTSDIDVDQADADAEAERHDEFMNKLVRDEYNFKVRMAKVIFDLESSSADHLPIIEYMAVYGTADRKFLATVAEARAAMPARLAKLRANDEAEAEREKPEIYGATANEEIHSGERV